MAEPRPVKCPECGSTRILRVVYGLPGPEARRGAEEGKYLLGGCDPGVGVEWGCADCHWPWPEEYDFDEERDRGEPEY